MKKKFSRNDFDKASLEKALFSLEKDVKISPFAKTNIKERLFARIYYKQNTSWKKNFTLGFWSIRKFLAGTLAIVLFFIGTILFLSSPTTSSARDFALLKVDGEVWIKRGIMLIVAGDDIKIMPGDLVETTENSRAEIYFIDNTVSRLGSNTTVSVRSFYIENSDSIQMPTQLELKAGNLWTRAINSPRTPGIEIKTPHGIVEAEHAAFNVEVSETETEVLVKDNTAKVKVFEPSDTKTTVAETKLNKDEKIVFNTASSEELLVSSVGEETQQEKTEWLAENEIADEEYLEEKKNEAQNEFRDEAGSLPGEPLYPVKKLAQDARVSLTFSDAEKIRVELGVAKTNFSEAILMLEGGQTESAEKALQDFEQSLTQISEKIQDDESEVGIEIRKETKEMLNTFEEKLVVAPSSSQKVKDVLLNLKLKIEKDPLKKTKIYSESASQKFIDASDLIKKQDLENAKNSLQNYKAEIETIVESVEGLSSEEASEVVLEVLSNHSENLDTLSSLVSDEDSSEMQALITEAKADINMALDGVIQKIEESEATTGPSPKTTEEAIDKEPTLLEGNAGAVVKPVESDTEENKGEEESASVTETEQEDKD